MAKSKTGYVVVGPDGFTYWRTAKAKRKDALWEWLVGINLNRLSWGWWYRKGYRCKKLQVA
jgi:hypothetical protein